MSAVKDDTMIVVHVENSRPLATSFDNLGRFVWRTMGVPKERVQRALEETGEFVAPGIRIVLAH